MTPPNRNSSDGEHDVLDQNNRHESQSVSVHDLHALRSFLSATSHMKIASANTATKYASSAFVFGYASNRAFQSYTVPIESTNAWYTAQAITLFVAL